MSTLHVIAHVPPGSKSLVQVFFYVSHDTTMNTHTRVRYIVSVLDACENLTLCNFVLCCLYTHIHTMATKVSSLSSLVS